MKNVLNGGREKSKLMLLNRFSVIECEKKHGGEKNYLFIYMCIYMFIYIEKRPVTVLEWPRGFQEVKVPKFHCNGTGWM